MKILVVGDYISDVYTYGKALRLCPEAPVPVIIPEKEIHSDGGAGLVFNQLKELGAEVQAIYGSESVKYRYFAGSHLICRVDNDSYSKNALEWSQFPNADAYVIADYGKGGMTQWLGINLAKCGKPIFVDAKHHWHWYAGAATTIFPNNRESGIAPADLDPTQAHYSCDFAAIVHKLGAEGCTLHMPGLNHHIASAVGSHEVVDVTGAGDIFMASYVYAATSTILTPIGCLRFANAMAGESCRHVGTWTVSQGFAQAYLDRLRSSEESAQSIRDCSLDSSQLVQQQHVPQGQISETLSAEIGDNPRGYSAQELKDMKVGLGNFPDVQIPPESPSIPIELSDIGSPLGLEISHTPDTKLQSDWKILNPIEFERLYGHKPAPDQPLLWKRSKLQV